MIIECSLKSQSDDVGIGVLTSRNDVRDLIDDDNDDEMSIFTIKQHYKSLK